MPDAKHCVNLRISPRFRRRRSLSCTQHSHIFVGLLITYTSWLTYFQRGDQLTSLIQVVGRVSGAATSEYDGKRSRGNFASLVWHVLLHAERLAALLFTMTQPGIARINRWSTKPSAYRGLQHSSYAFLDRMPRGPRTFNSEKELMDVKGGEQSLG